MNIPVVKFDLGLYQIPKGSRETKVSFLKLLAPSYCHHFLGMGRVA